MKRILALLAVFILSINFSFSENNLSSGIAIREKTAEWMNARTVQFTENKGQVVDMNNHLRPDILFSGETAGMKIYLRKTGLSYVIIKEESSRGEISETEKIETENMNIQHSSNIIVHRIDMEFIGGNINPEIVASGQTEGYNNYYFAHCPQGITGVKGYAKVVYKDIYPGIDIVFMEKRTMV